MSERRNKNRGFKQLHVWQHALELYKLTIEMLETMHFQHQKSKANTADAAHSILRNIAEGYCRRSAKEYLNFLNIALASCGELNSSMLAFNASKLIDDESFETFDKLHYQTENELLALAHAIQNKINLKQPWDESYAPKKKD